MISGVELGRFMSIGVLPRCYSIAGNQDEIVSAAGNGLPLGRQRLPTKCSFSRAMFC